MEPGEVLPRPELLGLVPPVLAPLDVGLDAEDSRAPESARAKLGPHEWADVQADAVVDVGVPANWLRVQRFPPDEDVERRFALQDALKLALQIERGGEAGVRAVLALPLLRPLPFDPVVQVGVGERFQRAAALSAGGRETVVVDQRVETVLATVPDVPDERPVVE